jgi:hypothetical protein
MINKLSNLMHYWIPPLISIAIILFYTAGILFVFNYLMKDIVIIGIAIGMIICGFLSLAGHISSQ